MLIDTFTTTVELRTYEACREALFSPHLSRTFDTRGYRDGNIREGIVSTAHGPMHRARRRVENTQFRPDKLRLYEQELFPQVLSDLLDQLIVGEEIDLYRVGETLASVLASRRTGLDIRERDLDELAAIVEFVDIFSQGAAILDSKDPDAVRATVYDAYERFDREYVTPARQRREGLLARLAGGDLEEDDLTHDILTALLQHRTDPSLELMDGGRIVREVATYLQGGTHTNGQTLVNAVDLLFEAEAGGRPGLVERTAEDRAFAQRVVHETLRIRPTTPKIRRRTVADVTIGGQAIPEGSLVIVDVVTANQDPAFGDEPARFDPDRAIAGDVPRWGLSFGGGAHICPGRTVAGGFPAPDAHGSADDPSADEHLFGLVALMVQGVLRRGIVPRPGDAGVRDTRTERFTRWAHYWVRVGAPRAASAVR